MKSNRLGTSLADLLSTLAGTQSGFRTHDVETTIISMGEDGSVQRLRLGTETKIVPLKDIPGIDPELVDAWEAVAKLELSIREKRKDASRLTDEANALEADIGGRMIDLRFAISQLLPDNYHYLYGQAMTLSRHRGAIIINGSGGEEIELDEGVGLDLLEQQDQLGNDQSRVATMHEDAARLNREAQALPALFGRKKRIAVDKTAQHQEFIAELYPGAVDFTIGCLGDQVTLVVTTTINETGEDLPPAEQALLRAMCELSDSRGNGGANLLSDGQRQTLGLPASAAEQITAPAETEPAPVAQ